MRETEPMEKNRTTPKGLALVALTLGALVLAACATTSTVFTDPPGLTVVVDGKDFGKSPAKIESTGTTFGDYHLEVKDENGKVVHRSEEHTSELQSRLHLVCRLLLEKKNKTQRSQLSYWQIEH